jgi:serine/threonine kinase PknH
MAVFVTYARKDRAAVEALARDLDRSHNAVWLDQELTGGQAWWDAILGQIRACDLYVFALSPESLRSRACKSELEYALAVRRPLLPVLIQDVTIAHAPPAIANTQIVDYRVRNIENGIALISAVANRPAVPPLPNPLPVPPAPPMSYMNQFVEILDAPYLTFREQNHLLADLRAYLGADEDDRNSAVQLIRGLRQRRDVAEGIAREIDQMLGPVMAGRMPPQEAARGPSPRPTPQPTPSGPPPPRSAPQYPLPTGQPIVTWMPSGPVPPEKHPQAVLVLVLGILGFLTWGITGLVAGILGGRVVRETDAQPGRYRNRSLASLGRGIGWTSVILFSAYTFVVFLSALAY